MIVDWVALQKFIDDCKKIKTKDDWDKARIEAKSMDKLTSKLAIEHLYPLLGKIKQ